jgi:hypothetical protein
MHDNPMDPQREPEVFLAALTEVAYRVALRRGIKGPFVELELEPWKALRAALAQEKGRRIRAGISSNRIIPRFAPSLAHIDSVEHGR